MLMVYCNCSRCQDVDNCSWSHRYMQCFQRPTKLEQMSYEVSDEYFTDHETPYRANNLLKSAKILIVLEDPVKRAFNHYQVGILYVSWCYLADVTVYPNLKCLLLSYWKTKVTSHYLHKKRNEPIPTEPEEVRQLLENKAKQNKLFKNTELAEFTLKKMFIWLFIKTPIIEFVTSPNWNSIMQEVSICDTSDVFLWCPRPTDSTIDCQKISNKNVIKSRRD